MDIYICTYGRHDRQITYDNLPPEIQERTILVVQDREAHKYDPKYNLLVLPPLVSNLPQTREYLKTYEGDKKMVMLDDDLKFARRRFDDPTKFADASPIELELLFNDIELQLDSYAHVGISGREGANRNTDAFLFNTRMMRVLAYRRDVLRGHRIEMDTLPDMEDFHVTLQLLRLGYSNCVINGYVQDQQGSNTEGGVSKYRTAETHARDCHILAELHPGFVTVVKKITKKSWGGGERTDVRIQWKKAYQSAGLVRVLGGGEGEYTDAEGG